MRWPVILGACAALALAACEREERVFREPPPARTPVSTVVLNDANMAGAGKVDPDPSSAYDRNAWAVSEGQVLYEQMNCAGCHSPRGGGGFGPPLKDSLWLYGAEPENIRAAIVEGRPNGMPSFNGKLSDDQLWKLVAYVRSLAGLTPAATRAARLERMQGTTTPPHARPNTPMAQRIPPESFPPDSAARRRADSVATLGSRDSLARLPRDSALRLRGDTVRPPMPREPRTPTNMPRRQ